jgi:hypothetical protein
MTGTQSDNRGYGKLIWPQFYGPSKQLSLLRFHMAALILVVLILLAFLVHSLWETDRLLVVISFIFTITVFGIMISYYWEKTKGLYFKLVEKGALDWDLYENGILEKTLSDDETGKIDEEFDYFSDYSKVCINIGTWNEQKILERVKAAAKRARELDGGKFNEADFASSDERHDFIKDYIWFFDNKDGQEDFELQRACLRDQNRFESILRQKIKDVE